MTHSPDKSSSTPVEQKAVISKKKILKNSIALYGYLFLAIIVGLYNSRVVLNELGVENYGVYTAVSVIIPFITFIGTSFSSTISRFFNIEIGRGNQFQLKKLFTNAMIVQFLVVSILFVIIETAGLWFLNYHLVLPEASRYAAHWVFHLSAIDIFIIFTQSPYIANMYAYENISEFSMIRSFQCVLKLLSLVVLIYAPLSHTNKLILYGFLLLFISLITTIIFRVYCIRKYQNCRFKWSLADKTLIKELVSFSSFDMFSSIGKNVEIQGIPVVINNAFGVILNAANGIASTVCNQLRSVVNVVTTTFNPQIIILYSQNQLDKMFELFFLAVKLLTTMMAIMFSIFYINSNFLLQLWLVKVPPHVGVILNICLIELFFDVLLSLFKAAIIMIGEIKHYSIIQGVIRLLVIPFILLLLVFFHSHELIFWVMVFGTFLCFIHSVFEFKFRCKEFPLLHLSNLFLKLIIPIIALLVLINYASHYIGNTNNWYYFVATSTIVTLVILLIGFINLNAEERKQIHHIILKRFKR